jgi:cytochrome c553
MAVASARGADPPARPSFDPEEVFNRADTDGDGKMSRQEFQLVAANGPRLRDDPQRADRVFRMLDTDRDGSLSPDEFRRLAAMRGGGPSARPPAPAERTPEKAPEKTADRPPTADQLAFFEKKVRPVLVQQCYECHSAQAKKVKGGLLLDTREGARRGGEQGPAVVPGDLEASLLVQAVRYEDESLQMPPKHRLPAEVVADLEQWVRSGAADPRDGKAIVRSDIDIEKGRQFWAFQPPRAVTPPTVQDAAWPRSDVDRFLLAAMEARGVRPVGNADRAALLRRLSFDLTGLPPKPAEVEAFLADKSPVAVERVVDRLLESSAFGDRWGRHWLDVARYAESSGKQVNLNYPYAWRYRDYVIDSFNADKPFNQFAMEQVAGDLMPARDDRQRAERAVATGFLAIGPKSHNERSRLQFDLELADEQIDATTQAFLGLTVACARCHDHKFDPIPQRDYYALAGIFRSTETLFGTTLVIQNNRRTTELLELPAGANPPTISKGLSPDARANLNRQLESMQARQREIARGGRAATQGNGEYLRRQAQIHLIEARLANFNADGKPRPLAMAARDRRQPADSPLYTRGEPDAPGEVVPRGLPQVLADDDGRVRPSGSGRLELAEFLGSDQNPLTARVWVNRVWLHLFGQGLVPSPDNFGASGTPPTNQPLLDALAVQFMADGWSTKRLVRRLVLTRAYGLASAYDARNQEIDPENALVWRAASRRLDAEGLRDAMLVVAGTLDAAPPVGSLVARVGDGPSSVMLRFNQEIDQLNVRSVYLPVVRDHLPDALAAFDFAEPSLVTGQRATTSVPSQSLYLMNSPFVIDAADAAASRLAREVPDERQRVRQAYLAVLNRPPAADERAAAERFLNDYAATVTRGAEPRRDAWTAFVQALLGSAEFLYLN